MPSKLAFQIQKPEYPAWLKDHVKRSGTSWVKIINPDQGEAQPFGPDVNYIGRLWWLHEPDREMVYRGAPGADEWWAAACPRMQDAWWINHWEGPNEPNIDSPERAWAFVQFEQRRLELLHDSGRVGVSGCFSTGQPDLGLWPILGNVKYDYLALHEYGMGRMVWDGVHLGRYENVIVALGQAGHDTPKIMITETGVDRAGNPETDGWRYQGLSEQDYLAQLIASDYGWQRDPEIVCAAPFAWETDGWPGFHIDYQMSARITAYMQSMNYTPRRVIGDEAQKHIIPLNPDAAFERAAAPLGRLPASREFDVEVNGILYRAQAYREPNEREWQWIAYCTVGDWGNVRWFRRAN